MVDGEHEDIALEVAFGDRIFELFFQGLELGAGLRLFVGDVLVKEIIRQSECEIGRVGQARVGLRIGGELGSGARRIRPAGRSRWGQ